MTISVRIAKDMKTERERFFKSGFFNMSELGLKTTHHFLLLVCHFLLAKDVVNLYQTVACLGRNGIIECVVTPDF